MAPALANALFDALGVRIDQVPIQPHMILSALQAKQAGNEPSFGPKTFPSIDYGESLIVPTPAEGGDGTAINDPQASHRSKMRGESGTMSTREEALREKTADLTTR